MTRRPARGGRARLLRAAAVCGVGFVVLLAALQGDAATTLVVGTAVLVAVVAGWRRNATAAASLVSLAVTLLATSMLTEWAGDQTPMVSPLQSGLVFWLFAGVVLGVVWLVPAGGGRSRAVTTVLAQTVLVVASPFVVFAPVAAPLVGLGLSMAVVWYRSRRGRPPAAVAPAPPGPDVAARARGVERTRAVVAGSLGPGWTVRGDAEPLVLVGPPGLFVVETRSWPGTVTLVEVDTAAGTAVSAYALDGQAHELAARLQPVARTVVRTAAGLGVERPFTHGVVVLWSDTTVPDGQVELTVLAGDATDDATDGVDVALVRGECLLDWLRAWPSRLDDSQLHRLARRLERTDLSTSS